VRKQSKSGGAEQFWGVSQKHILPLYLELPVCGILNMLVANNRIILQLNVALATIVVVGSSFLTLGHPHDNGSESHCTICYAAHSQVALTAMAVEGARYIAVDCIVAPRLLASYASTVLSFADPRAPPLTR
jgi:hypothetical protein